MSDGLKKFFRIAIPTLFYVLLVVFLGIYVAGVDWGILSRVQFDWGFIAIATLLSLAFRYWGVFIWLFLLVRLGAKNLRGQYTELSLVYAKSWLGRYIPGAATWILGKIYFASRLGISKGRLAISGLLEGGIQIVTTLALALILLLLDPRTAALDEWFRVAILLAFVGCVVALIPRVFEFLINVLLRLLKRPTLDPELRPSFATIGWTVMLYALGAVVAGASYFFIAAAIYPSINWADAVFIIGAASLASAVSMLAIFAPGGLGVREGVLGLLLALVVPGQIALVIVVVTRVWSILVDGIFFVIAWGAHGVKRLRNRDIPEST